MTGFATGRGMLTNQWENTDVMVKPNLVLPGNLVVTLAALGALFLLVGVILLMAAIAGGVDCPGFCAGKMAGCAQQVFMSTLEWEVGFSVVIKGCKLPPPGAVTILALLAIRSLVNVVSTMTAITVTRCSAIF